MPLYFGSAAVSKVYLGNTQVQAAYLGTTSLLSSTLSFSTISPNTGDVSTAFTVTGSGFSASGLTVTVGGYAVNNLQVSSDTSMSFKIAGAVLRGVQPIVITTANGSVTNSTALTVIRPTITNFTPTTGSVGTDMTINGADFIGTMTILFTATGQQPVEATNVTVVSANQMVCKVPTLTAGTSYRVSVANSNQAGSTSDTMFVYGTPAPTYASISPASGSPGSTVSITGTNFVSGSTTVTIGGLAATTSVVSSTLLSCTVPSGLANNTAYNVVITTSSGSATGTGVFTCTIPSPTYTGVSPSSGKLGTTVTITGTNFLSGMTVTVGGTAATGVSVTSSTSLTCSLPALSSAGYKDIVLTTASGSVIGSNAVQYYLAPTISSTSVPQANPGTVVTINGTNFVGGGTSVTVGGTTATVTNVQATQVRFSMPTLSGDGSKSLVVTTPGGSASSTIAYYAARSAVTTSYTTAGSGSYSIPAWCNKVDVVVVGGGGGGNGGGAGMVNGGGGGGGLFGAATIYRGSDVTWGTTTLSYTVGAGGAGAPDSYSAGQNGTASSAVGGAVSGSGGQGGKGQGIVQKGYNAGNYASGSVYSFNGVTYPTAIGTGGTEGVGFPYTAAGKGGTPGGGGGGGGGIVLGTGTPGGAGGVGGVFFRAYQ